MSPPVPGTVVIYGPFFARTGFGILARGWAMALHKAGVKVRIVPVDCNDPNASGDLDDCDLYLLQSLKYTPLTTPVTAIFAYVPTYIWPKVQLPEPNLRILLTTFDSSANAAVPPSRLTFIGNQMDQVWLANKTEEQAWIRGGLKAEKVHSFNWPHEWIDNPRLGAATIKTPKPGVPFRFLHISLFLPRRRLDVLLRAFFQEFQSEQDAELYLKMSYPAWHPVPGKPKKDLRALIDQLRKETGSRAGVIVDESLGTRLELARLIDSCDAYISPDTTHTAPVTEAIVRNRPVIITDGWGVDLPPEAFVVPNSEERVVITPEMAEYMPHQRGASFPALDVGLMRQALRRAFALSADERCSLVKAATQYMRERYSYAATAPAALNAMRQGWADKEKSIATVLEVAPVKTESATPKISKPLNIHWSGLQLFYGKIPTANRELCLELLRRGHRLSLSPGHGPFHIEEFDLSAAPKYAELARRFHEPIKAPADFEVSFRWHPIFGEQPAAHHILASTWWFGTIPNDWVKPISESIREVWVPSGCVRDNFLRGGIAAEQLQVIPPGIDPALFRPGIAPYSLATKRRFKFLFVGETTPRKGLDVLLSAYMRTFKKTDDVCLVIKDMDCEDYYVHRAAQTLIRKCQADPQCPEIEYLPTMLSEESLASLYAACDCFVQPHRASSFGLAVLEAMACGLPVITTNYGGVLEFCNDRTAYLLPAREVRQRRDSIGHWKVNGELLHAEIAQSDLQDRMDFVFRNSSEPRQLAQRASNHVRENFTWAKAAEQIELRFQALQSAHPESAGSDTRHRARPRSASEAANAAKVSGPTLVIVAPFYNRSGYGVAARSLAAALHGAGMKIRIAPVDNVEDGIDDCDLAWLKSLEKTPVTQPVTAIFFHVPNPAWLKVQLPPHSQRVMFTTFDSSAQGNLPPKEWISVINQMDQLWLMTAREASVFAAAGVPEAKIHVVKSPHPWINNPLLPLVQSTPKPDANRFRFLCVSMFLPRRRWDALIEAFLLEFQSEPAAELYLKVNYPSWHPVPGQPQKDLRALVESLRAKTGSAAKIVLDDSLDTRLGICRLMDSCDAYVSTDTSITAPVGEAFVRGKVAVLPDGYGVALPYCEGAFVIPVDPQFTQPMTEAMLAYQPHHRGKQMPLLHVDDIRRTLRAAFESPEPERQQKGRLACLVMECLYGPTVTNPLFLKAINAGWQKISTAIKPNTPTTAGGGKRIDLNWIGSFLDHGSLSHVNRELTQALQLLPGIHLQRITNGAPAAADAATVWPALAAEVTANSLIPAAITVRHAWPPDWRRPKQGALVVIQPWEFGALPEDWVRQARDVDEFWVPSTFVRNCYVESGIAPAKVYLIPNGVDVERFRPDAPARSLATQKKFKFLFVGGTIGRKGPDVLLKAYLNSFTDDDDVCLVIKDFGGQSIYSNQTFAEQIKTAQAQPNAPEIVYLDTELSPQELPGLYTACDCLVHPYRGEGFGLPVLEAMACGLPVIVTGGGATDDFATDEIAYRLPSTRRSIGNEVSGLKLSGDGWLLEPDGAALVERMKWILANRDAAREKGRAASEHARRNWTWKHAAEVAAGRLEQLMNTNKHAVPATSRKQPAPPRPSRESLPACARLGELDEARARSGRRDLAGAWQAALTDIQLRPFHPEAHLLLAEIALAAGDSVSARQLAQRARDLAPGWKSPKHFLQKPLKGNARPDWLHLPEETQSSTPINRERAPINRERELKTQNHLTVCVIAKNEERFIAQCLQSIRSVASQIILVDTGSTDRTVEIAKANGAEIFHHPWDDDFSAARNAALEHATGDWILMLDADEELTADQHAALLSDMNKATTMAFRLPLVNAGQNDGRSFVPRLFRNAPGIYYSGRIHEQVFPSLLPFCKTWGLETALGTARLLHHGYTKEIIKDRNKIERNLRLLQQAIIERPDDVNLQMNLGLERVRSGELPAGLTNYREAFRLMSAQSPGEIAPELREVLLTQFAAQLYKVRGHEEVVRALNSPLAKSAGLTSSMHFALGLAHHELKQYREAAEHLRQCLAKRKQPALSPVNTDIFTAAPFHCLALSLAHAGDLSGAEQAFLAALDEPGVTDELKLDYAKLLASQNRPVDALHKLHEVVGRNSTHANAWRLGGEIALKQSGFLEFGCDWTSEAIQHLPNDPVIIAQRAEALLLNQETANARPLWERACNGTRPPRALAALILCAAVEAETVPGTQNPAEEIAASRAFVEWYQQLVSAGAQDTIIRLNLRVDALRQSLPTAAGLLDSALMEAAKQPA